MPHFRFPVLPPKGVLSLVIAAVATLGFASGVANKLAYTGDEPRYLLYALSLRTEGKAVMSENGYEVLRKEARPGSALASLPLKEIQSNSNVPAHSILLPLLLSPVVTSLSLGQLRLLSLVAGLAGLYFLARLLIEQKLSIPAALACLVPAAAFLPIFPFYFLVLPEAYLFLLVCVAFWNLLGTHTERLRDFAPSILCSCLAPFVHLRGLPLFVTVPLYLILKLGWRRTPCPQWPALVKIGIVYFTAGAGVLLYNSLIYGSITGSVTTARPALSLAGVAHSFLDAHLGLFPYAPIFALSAVGLIEGFWRRREWAVPAAVFFTALVGTTVGVNAGESYPARFWVIGVPVLAICLIGFVQGRMLTAGKMIIYALLGVVSLANTILFVIYPGLHLAARTGPLPYDRLFELIPWIHLGFWLGLLENNDYLFKLICCCSIWVATAAVALLYRSRIATAAAALLLLLAFEAHRASPIRYSARLDPDSMAVVVEDPTVMQRAPMRLTVRAPWQPPFPRHTIFVTDSIRRWEQISTNNVLLHQEGPWQVPLSLRVNWHRPESAMADANAVRVALSDSWLVRLWSD